MTEAALKDLAILAASALVAGLLVLAVRLFGHVGAARIDADQLAALAAAEGQALAACAVDARGRAGLARLADGRWLAARAMGADVAVRLAPAGAARARIGAKRAVVALGDPGFPPITIAYAGAEPPNLLRALAEGRHA